MQKSGYRLWVCAVLHHSLFWVWGAPIPLGAAAEALGVARYLQLFDLLQQVLQGHVLVTGVLLPDGVLQALQVGFGRLSLFKKLLGTATIPVNEKTLSVRVRILNVTQRQGSQSGTSWGEIFRRKCITSGLWIAGVLQRESWGPGLLFFLPLLWLFCSVLHTPL